MSKRFEVRYKDGNRRGSVVIKDAKDEEDARDKFSVRVPADEILDVIDLSEKKHNPNMARIQRARKAVRGYAGEFHDLKANITDILTDLRHLCAAKGVSFEDADRVARQHFEAEAPARK